MSNISIVGGGFAGLWAAMSAAAERDRLGISPNDLTIDLISNTPDLVMRPRLYEGAKPDMRVPLRPLLDTIKVQFDLATVVGVRPSENLIDLSELSSGRSLRYDRLILASGSHMPTLPIPGAANGFSIDTFSQAEKLDNFLEGLSRHNGRDLNGVTIVVVGASFTGIELVTELRQRLGTKVRLVLLDHAEHVGSDLGANLNPVILNALSECDIDIRLGEKITSAGENSLLLEGGEVIAAAAVVFATGLRASPLTAAFNAETDPAGRLLVNEFLGLEKEAAVFIAGDVARAMADDDHATFMSCQHATELGRYAGYNAVQSLTGGPLRPYRQESYATCLDLGPAGAVFTTGWDREVQKTGSEGKSIKRQINQEWIYPPKPSVGTKAIFQAVSLTQSSQAA
ncbi:MAG TPA: hypothetical protein DIT67_06765 [Octadecabacter sp.]|nr:hypothetical protein [Octadecabacter sp.]